MATRLTEKQMQAVILLIEPSTERLQDTAARLGISPRTLRRWRADPLFQAEEERAFRARLDVAIHRRR